MVDALNAHHSEKQIESAAGSQSSQQAQLLRSFLNPRRLEAHLGNSFAVHSPES